MSVSDDRSITETIRTRVLRGLRGGTLSSGDRLPSARELVPEFGVDHRLILASYRQLVDEGLVEIRERGGVYVAPVSPRSGTLALPVKWFAETFTEAFAREIPAIELVEYMRRSIETLRLHAVVISSTDDQVAGLARELREDFGLFAEGMTASAIESASNNTAPLRRADVIIGTSAHVELMDRVAAELDKPCIAIDVRPDLVVGEWAMLLKQPVWVIVATREFGEMLKQFFANVKGVENMRILVNGEDDLADIPDGAPTYITHRVRETLETRNIRGKILPAARTISVDSARKIFDFMVHANARAFQAMREP